ncbi:MAG: type II toxin-antitoxin system VapC family toxin [Polyangiales bacterium]
MQILLDTHILLWWLEDKGRLSDDQSCILQNISAKRPAFLASVTLWEVATLVSLGRIRLRRPLRDWLQAASAPPLVRLVPLSASIAAEVAALPNSFHRDPADRILVATARVLGLTMLTRDRRIVDAALVSTIT